MRENRKNMTIHGAITWGVLELSMHGFTDAPAEIEFFLEHILKCARHDLFLNSTRVLSDDETAVLKDFVARRILREPAQYITGEAFFRELTLKVTADTLIPRPETELLVEEAIQAVNSANMRSPVVVDLCTGSGCIGLSAAKEITGSRVYATDASEAALKTAAMNAVINGVDDRVTFLHGDLFNPVAGLEGKVDLLLSNPPYIAKADYEKLPPEILRYEPKEALLAGVDGLDYLRKIIDGAPFFIKHGGLLIMEIGYDQSDAVKGLINKNGGYGDVKIIKDFSDIDRVVRTVRR